MRIRRALLLSDVHLGWSVCSRQHVTLLERLPEAVDDAELIVLNGDILDGHRKAPTTIETDLIQRLADLVTTWRSEGREVVYIEGNHEGTAGIPGLQADRWIHDWEGANGEVIRVLHGHRFTGQTFRQGHYENLGRHILHAENLLYAYLSALRSIYRFGPGWIVGAYGLAEDMIWIRPFPEQVAPLLSEASVLVHGHFHFGQGHWTIGGKQVWRTGAWVSQGHLGSVDRMLRYKDGRFERIGLGSKGFRVFDDGR